jgi:hypothetical protein
MEGKSWYESKAIWGGIITGVCGLAAIAGHSIPADTQTVLTNQIVQVATAIATIVGSGLAIYGRLRADKVIR